MGSDGESTTKSATTQVRGPSSASVAEPLNTIESPTFHVSELTGVLILGVGYEASPVSTVTDAMSESPFESVTLSDTRWTTESVNV